MRAAGKAMEARILDVGKFLLGRCVVVCEKL
jgi:hypothetical protein